MIKLILFSEMNPDHSEAYINPEDISSIAHAGDGPNNEGQTKIFMKSQVCYDVVGFASDIVQRLIKEGDVQV